MPVRSSTASSAPDVAAAAAAAGVAAGVAVAAASASTAAREGSQVPVDIITWILNITGRPVNEHVIQQIQIRGLDFLTGRDLRCVWSQIRQFPAVQQKRHSFGTPNGNKTRMSSSLMSYCTDAEVIEAIRKRSIRQHTAAAPATPHPFSTPPGYPHKRPAVSQQQSTLSCPSPYAPTEESRYQSMHAAMDTYIEQRRQLREQQRDGSRPMAAGASAAGQDPYQYPDPHLHPSQFYHQQQQQQSTSGGHAAPGKRQKTEHPPDREVTPQQGTREPSLMEELLPMGFTDRRELLTVIRKCLEDNPACSADDCMLECVRVREEMEEARKMDAARLASERSRKEEAAARRASVERETDQMMREAAVREWRMTYFPDSWLLRDDELCDVLDQALSQEHHDDGADDGTKQAMLDLLKQEKKARKWYDAVLPSAWFARVCAKRLVEADTCLHEAIQAELSRLETGMYSLSEQTQGGVPKMFIAAMDQYGVCNVETGREDDNEEETQTRAAPRIIGTEDSPIICID